MLMFTSTICKVPWMWDVESPMCAKPQTMQSFSAGPAHEVPLLLRNNREAISHGAITETRALLNPRHAEGPSQHPGVPLHLYGLSLKRESNEQER